MPSGTCLQYSNVQFPSGSATFNGGENCRLYRGSKLYLMQLFMEMMALTCFVSKLESESMQKTIKLAMKYIAGRKPHVCLHNRENSEIYNVRLLI